MKKITLFAAAAALVLGASCAKDETSSSNNYTPVPQGESRYAIITKVTSASTDNTSLVVLTEDDLSSGSTTIIGQGSDLGDKSPSEWTASPDGQYIYSIQDGGGGTLAQVVQYYLDSNTGLVSINKEYEVSEYHTWGMWGNNYVALRNSSSTSVGITDSDDGVTYYQPVIAGAVFSPLGFATYVNDTPSANYVGKNYSGSIEGLDNGETALIVGHATSGKYVYASFATSGVSRYEMLDSDNRTDGWHSNGTADKYENYVAEGAGSYDCYYSTEANVSVNESENPAITSITNTWNNRSITKNVPFPLTPGNTYIARYDVSGSVSDTPTIIATDKMAQAFGRQSGNPYNMVIPNEDDGSVYVFSPGTTRRYTATVNGKNQDGYVETVTEYSYGNVGVSGQEIGDLSIATTNKGAKVMRIRYGRTEFDSNFGKGSGGVQDITIEDDNGDELVFSRVWHISGNKFLMRVIHTPGVFNVMHHNYRDPGDAYFYIYDASTNEATKVTGLPEPDDFVGQTRSSIGEPYIENGMVYLPMAPSTESYPLIYVINSADATAQKGLEVKSSYIVAIAKLTAM